MLICLVIRFDLLVLYSFSPTLTKLSVEFVYLPAPGWPGAVADSRRCVQMYRRDGWMHRSVPADCNGDPPDPQLHCFPARLVAAPLERRPFGAHQLPVPWLGFEIQKYLFPNSWFRDYTPAC